METIYFADFVRRQKEGKSNSNLFKSTTGTVLSVPEFCKEVDIVANKIKQRSQRKRINLEKFKYTPEEENALYDEAERVRKLFEYIAEYYFYIKNKPEFSHVEKEYIYELQEDVQNDALTLWEICIDRKIYRRWKPL